MFFEIFKKALQRFNWENFENYNIPYLRHCSPGVLFFNMGFWVGVNSKNPPKSGLFKQKVYSRKTPKTRLFTLPGAQFKSGAAMTWIR